MPKTKTFSVSSFVLKPIAKQLT